MRVYMISNLVIVIYLIQCVPYGLTNLKHIFKVRYKKKINKNKLKILKKKKKKKKTITTTKLWLSISLN